MASFFRVSTPKLFIHFLLYVPYTTANLIPLYTIALKVFVEERTTRNSILSLFSPDLFFSDVTITEKEIWPLFLR